MPLFFVVVAVALGKKTLEIIPETFKFLLGGFSEIWNVEMSRSQY